MIGLRIAVASVLTTVANRHLVSYPTPADLNIAFRNTLGFFSARLSWCCSACWCGSRWAGRCALRCRLRWRVAALCSVPAPAAALAANTLGSHRCSATVVFIVPVMVWTPTPARAEEHRLYGEEHGHENGLSSMLGFLPALCCSALLLCCSGMAVFFGMELTAVVEAESECSSGKSVAVSNPRPTSTCTSCAAF
jgi:hypothetical protein